MSKKTVSIPTKVRKPETADEWVGSTNPAPEPEPVGTEEKVSTKRFTIDLPANLHKRFKSFCVENETNMADEIRTFIEKRISDKA